MKRLNVHTLRLILSLFLLGLVLLLLGLVLYYFPLFSDSLGVEGRPSFVPVEVVATIVGAFVSVIGLVITSVLSWREDRRKEKFYEMEMERLKFEIEKLKLELDMLHGVK